MHNNSYQDRREAQPPRKNAVLGLIGRIGGILAMLVILLFIVLVASTDGSAGVLRLPFSGNNFSLICRDKQMDPYIKQGDLVMCTMQKTDTMRLTDVVVYWRDANNIAMSRLMSKSEDSKTLIVAPDANNNLVEQVDSSNVIGKATSRIAGMGGLLNVMASSKALFMVFLVLLLVVTGLLTFGVLGLIRRMMGRKDEDYYPNEEEPYAQPSHNHGYSQGFEPAAQQPAQAQETPAPYYAPPPQQYTTQHYPLAPGANEPEGLQYSGEVASTIQRPAAPQAAPAAAPAMREDEILAAAQHTLERFNSMYGKLTAQGDEPAEPPSFATPPAEPVSAPAEGYVYNAPPPQESYSPPPQYGQGSYSQAAPQEPQAQPVYAAESYPAQPSGAAYPQAPSQPPPSAAYIPPRPQRSAPARKSRVVRSVQSRGEETVAQRAQEERGQGESQPQEQQPIRGRYSSGQVDLENTPRSGRSFGGRSSGQAYAQGQSEAYRNPYEQAPYEREDRRGYNTPRPEDNTQAYRASGEDNYEDNWRRERAVSEDDERQPYRASAGQEENIEDVLKKMYE